MFEEFWIESVLPVLLNALLAALTIATGYGVAALRRAAESSKSKWINETMDAVADAAEMAVGAANQLFVDELRRNSKDGRLTPDEISDAARMAFRVAMEQLGVQGMKQLVKVTGGRDEAAAVLKSNIEAKVAQAKVVDPSAMHLAQLRTELLRLQ